MTFFVVFFFSLICLGSSLNQHFEMYFGPKSDILSDIFPPLCLRLQAQIFHSSVFLIELEQRE